MGGVHVIDDARDPRLEAYTNLKDGARIRQRGQFVSESRPVVARLLIDRPELVESVLVTPRQWANLETEVRAMPDVTVYVAERPVLEDVVGFPIHRGCLALARCPALDPPTLWAPGPGWWLGLEGISDHDNAGSLFRTAHAMGARGVMHDPKCADPLYRRSVRVSMGATFLLPRAVDDGPRLVERCRQAGIRTAALTPRGETELRWGKDPYEGDRWVLWMGAEGEGLSETLLSAADLRLRIPIAAYADSLNVAVAAGLAAWAYIGRQQDRAE